MRINAIAIKNEPTQIMCLLTKKCFSDDKKPKTKMGFFLIITIKKMLQREKMLKREKNRRRENVASAITNYNPLIYATLCAYLQKNVAATNQTNKEKQIEPII